MEFVPKGLSSCKFLNDLVLWTQINQQYGTLNDQGRVSIKLFFANKINWSIR